MATKVEVNVMRYADGQPLGVIDMAAESWAKYADSAHPAYEWPAGVARAGDVLSDATIERLGIDPGATIYLD